MTSVFDDLEGIFHRLEINEKRLEFKKDAIQLAEKAKKQIERKIGKDKVRPGLSGWYWYFQAVHDNFDHTKEYHLKLILPRLENEIEELANKMRGKNTA